MKINRNAIVAKTVRLASRRICRNPVGVAPALPRSPKVDAGAPTLGWMPQSRWDCHGRGVAGTNPCLVIAALIFSRPGGPPARRAKGLSMQFFALCWMARNKVARHFVG